MALPDYIRDTGEALAVLPDSAATHAPRVDAVFYTLTAASLAVLVFITLLIFFFSVRYRASADVNRDDSVVRRRSTAIELTWSGVTLAVFLGFFFWGADLYIDAYRAPPDAAEVYVVGKQWMWKIQHANGVREINTLHVPAGGKVKLHMTSEDVIHSFYIPAFRLKQDVLPDRYTTYWFETTKPGVYSLFCAEFCGTDHSLMRGRVVVLRPADYQAWLADQPVPLAPAVEGEGLFRAYGCSGCHAPGSAVHAPGLVGLYGRPVQLAGGGSVIADESYLRDSILLPQKHVVAGYQPIMPSFQGQASEADILALIAYIKSLDQQGRGGTLP